MTGPAIIGHVGTNYIASHYKLYLSTRIEYLHSVTCIILPIECLVCDEKFMAIA